MSAGVRHGGCQRGQPGTHLVTACRKSCTLHSSAARGASPDAMLRTGDALALQTTTQSKVCSAIPAARSARAADADRSTGGQCDASVNLLCRRALTWTASRATPARARCVAPAPAWLRLYRLNALTAGYGSASRGSRAAAASSPADRLQAFARLAAPRWSVVCVAPCQAYTVSREVSITPHLASSHLHHTSPRLISLSGKVTLRAAAAPAE
jgi:hypothetical protein